MKEVEMTIIIKHIVPYESDLIADMYTDFTEGQIEDAMTNDVGLFPFDIEASWKIKE